jgi:ATP-dependent Clp protease ATP-binding subunit ClpC
LKEHNLIVNATLEALSVLAELGYDPEFGARPLRRIIQQKVEDPLSDKLLAGDFHDGASILINVDEDGEIALEREEEKAAAPTI